MTIPELVLSSPYMMHPRDYKDYDYLVQRWPSLFVQPKLNGVRALVSPCATAVISKSMKPWYHLSGIFRHGTDYWLDGEILWPRHSLQELAGALNSAELPADAVGELEFHAFDVARPHRPFAERAEFLRERVRTCANPQVHDVPASFATSVPPYNKFDWSVHPTELEGFVYKHPLGKYTPGLSQMVIKHKRLYDAEFFCLSIHEGKGKFSHMFGGALLELPDKRTFKCGGGFLTVADRQKLWTPEGSPVGKMVTVRYPYVSADGVPLQAQFVSVRNYE
jgi:ATP-dependent DNA ligase